MHSYDANNIFAKILKGDIACHKVYEDAATLAFMDLFPQSTGHTLVISKMAACNLLDADTSLLAPLMSTTQKISRAAMAAFKADGIIINQFNEAAAGQTVFHLHIHIIPCWQDRALARHNGEKMADPALLKTHAELLRKQLET